LVKLEEPPAQDEDEDIDVVLMSPQQVEQAIIQGDITDAKTISGFFLAQAFLQKA
jgi:ADP-ribose pyrophosphatase